MVNKPLIRPYFWGGYVRGGRLTSHKEAFEDEAQLRSIVFRWFQTGVLVAKS